MCLQVWDLSGAYSRPVYLSFHATYPLDEKILLTELFCGPAKQTGCCQIHTIQNPSIILEVTGLFPAAFTPKKQKIPIPPVNEGLLLLLSLQQVEAVVGACWSDKTTGWRSQRYG